MVATLGPGSAAPRNPGEVERLLRQIPAIAFVPELEPLLPVPVGDGPPSPQEITRAVDDAWLTRLVDALRAVEARAQTTEDGGLRFVAVTLRHFLTEERIAPGEHPLVVALSLRTVARRDGRPDGPADIARAMNRW